MISYPVTGVRGEEVFVILGFVGPAQGGEGPEGGGEPGVQSILVLTHLFTALGAGCGCVLGYNQFAAIIAIESGNSVSPPKLTGYTPIAYIFHPMEIVFIKSFGDKADIALSYRLYSRLGKSLHSNEPLLACSGLDSGAATVAGAYVVGVVLYGNKITALFKVFYNSLAGFVSVHTCVCGVIFGNVGIVGHYVYKGQTVACANLKVVGVVSGGDLNNAGTEIFFNVIIRNNGNFSANQRKHESFADKVLISFIARVNSHSGIAQKGFGSGGGKLYKFVTILYGVADMPEMSCLIFVFNLCIGNRGKAVGAPVYNTLTAVDKSFFVKAYENLFNRFGAAFVKSKTGSGPIAGGAELFKLFYNSSAVFGVPIPSAFKESVSADIFLGNALFAHLLNNFSLCCDRCVVGTGKPEGGKTAHTLITCKDILQSVIQSVSHVKLTRNVGWRHNNGVRLFGFVDFCVEISTLDPIIVNSRFYRLRIINF